MLRLVRFSLILIAFGVITSPVYALRPVVHYHDLVAGQGCAGYRDGEFATSLFHDPSGMALSNDHKKIYVADRENNRVRIVLLDQNNKVETLAGDGKPGHKDGNLTEATFNQPGALLMLPGDCLLVNDQGNNLLRVIDLKKQEVTTIAGNSNHKSIAEGPALTVSLNPVGAMSYFAPENSVYFSQPTVGSLKKLDLTSGLISIILSNNPQSPQPKALCVFQKHICFSDRLTNQVFEIESLGNTLAGQYNPTIRSIGAGQNIIALTESDENLYALQIGDAPLAKLIPYEPVHLMSPWGFSADLNDEMIEPVLHFDSDEPAGFIADPEESHKLYISSAYLQSIVSVKDYNFEKLSNAEVDINTEGLTDFDYPQKKPKNTFRILIVGDSLTTWTHALHQDPSSPKIRELTFPKKLELFLNTQAALNDLPVNFEVLVCRHYNTGGTSLLIWPYYEVPHIVDAFDIDLTILFTGGAHSFGNFQSLFAHPNTAEGILAHDFDPNFILNPDTVRFENPDLKLFFEKALKKALLTIDSAAGKKRYNFNNNIGLYLEDVETKSALEQIAVKPLALLKQKIEKTQTKDSQPRNFIITYAPTESLSPEDSFQSFWKDVCDKSGIPLMNLTSSFEALKSTYSPIYESGKGHFNIYGSELIAQVMCHALLHSPWSAYWQRNIKQPTTGSQSNNMPR